jgi:alkylation response protein AidB-like acyl-CoA dehydrogenase
MIDFEIGDELELVRQTARGFADDHLRSQLREHESARAPSAAAREAFAEIGFATLEWPEGEPAAELGALARCLVVEELAAADPGAALALDPLGPALYPLAEFGGREAVESFAAPLLGEAGRRAVLVWNGAGARGSLERRADTLGGVVPWVPADRVDLVVVLDEEGAAVIEQGIELEPRRGSGLGAAGASELTLHAAPLAAEWRDPAAAGRALARARLYVAGLLVGVMRESADYSRLYALDRVAFGKPIAHHQALAFLIADMAIALESARVLAWQAAWRLDAGLDAEEACATAFLEAAEAALFVTPNGVQILGGHGFMQDHPVEKFMREARTLGLLFGGVDAAREDAEADLQGPGDASLLALGAA